ncbi:MAG: putative glycoside hydrolase [Oscillospiraceae bacterium]
MKRRKRNDKSYTNEYARKHSSYTEFSHSYPGGAMGKRMSYTEKVRRKRIIKTVLAVVGVIAVVTAGYFVTDVLLNVSELPKQAEKSTAAQEPAQSTLPEPTTEKVQPAVISDEMKAIWIETKSLSSTEKMAAAIKKVKADGGNAVIIDFKNKDGMLCYDSSLEQAETAKTDEGAYPTVSECIALCKKENVQVIARIYCFRDPVASKKLGAAITYMGQKGVLWLDNSYENGGKTWFNPYSEIAQKYLLDIIKEVCALKVDSILLDAVQYPNAGLTKATFEGETVEGAPSRNQILNQFIEKAVSAAKSTTLICMVDGKAAVEGSSKIYDGTIVNSAAKAFAVNVTGIEVKNPILVQGKTVIPVNSKAGETSPYFVIPK